MQPYAFPYIGHFQLINCVDKWVVFDDTQYISKGWVNRNRILHPDLKKEWQYFTIPVKKHFRECRIKDVEINDEVEWRADFMGKLTSYKKKAPYYQETVEFVESCINFDSSSLSELVVNTLESTCNYLGLPFDYSLFSKMNVNANNVEHAGQWALEIADYMGADEYINPQGGYSIFKEIEFSEKNIRLRFLKSNLSPYVQRRGHFIAGLSIVDVMMWNDKNTIRDMLEDYEIVSQAQLRESHERF